MYCDVCNVIVTDKDATRISPEKFRILLKKGFGIDEFNIQMLTQSCMTRAEAIELLTQQYSVSQSDWLLCKACSAKAKQTEEITDYILPNKWTHGKVHFEVSTLPHGLENHEGIVPLEVMLEPRVGLETALFLIDRTPFIHNLAHLHSTTLNQKCGLYRTSEGPLLFLLYYFLDPCNPQKLYAGYDNYVNPLNPNHLKIHRRLAHQTHWHLILIGEGDELIDLYEAWT